MKRRSLIVATVTTGLALVLLLIYSFERTAWLFDLFEDWTPAARAAAVVVEVAAVALLVGAGAIAQLDIAARAWANRALVAVLSVQALANLTAGYLRGGQETLALFAGGNTWASYAVAATLWFTVNLAVPGLILCLSKLMERLLFAQQERADAPLREQVQVTRAELASTRELLAGATADLALARESEAGLRERLTAQAETAANGEAQARRLSERAANAEAAAANRERENAILRADLAKAREQTPTREWLLSHVREQTASGRTLSDVAREVGFNESTLRTMLKAEPREYVVADEEG